MKYLAYLSFILLLACNTAGDKKLLGEWQTTNVDTSVAYSYTQNITTFIFESDTTGKRISFSKYKVDLDTLSRRLVIPFKHKIAVQGNMSVMQLTYGVATADEPGAQGEVFKQLLEGKTETDTIKWITNDSIVIITPLRKFNLSRVN